MYTSSCPGATPAVDHIGQVFQEVFQGLDVELAQRGAGQCGDGDRHVLQVLAAAGRRDHHFLELVARGGRRVVRGGLRQSLSGAGQPEREADRLRQRRTARSHLRCLHLIPRFCCTPSIGLAVERGIFAHGKECRSKRTVSPGQTFVFVERMTSAAVYRIVARAPRNIRCVTNAAMRAMFLFYKWIYPILSIVFID